MTAKGPLLAVAPAWSRRADHEPRAQGDEGRSDHRPHPPTDAGAEPRRAEPRDAAPVLATRRRSTFDMAFLLVAPTAHVPRRSAFHYPTGSG